MRRALHARPEWRLEDVLRLTVDQITYLLTDPDGNAGSGGTSDSTGQLEFRPDGTVMVPGTAEGQAAWAAWQAAHQKGGGK